MLFQTAVAECERQLSFVDSREKCQAEYFSEIFFHGLSHFLSRVNLIPKQKLDVKVEPEIFSLILVVE